MISILPNEMIRKIYEFEPTYRKLYDETMKQIPKHLQKNCYNDFHENYKEPSNLCDIFEEDVGSYGHVKNVFHCTLLLQLTNTIVKCEFVSCTRHLLESIEIGLSHILNAIQEEERIFWDLDFLREPLSKFVAMLKDNFVKKEICVFVFPKNLRVVLYAGKVKCNAHRADIVYEEESMYKGYRLMFN
jgi:hypothetical protein